MWRRSLGLVFLCLTLAVNAGSSAGAASRLAGQHHNLPHDLSDATLGVALNVSIIAHMRSWVADGASFKSPMRSDRGVPDGVVCQESDW